MDFHGLPVQDIRSQLPRNYDPGHGPLTHRSLAIVTGIAVHWDAQDRPHAYDSVERYVGEANYHINKDWGSGWHGDGLMYHFKIDNTGVIFYTRDVSEMVWAVTDENPHYISICLDCGEGQEPTREQAEALQKLLDELCFNHPEFPATQGDVKGHKEVPSNSTACPGSFMPLVENYRAEKNVHPENYQYDWPAYEPAPTQPLGVAPQPVAPNSTVVATIPDPVVAPTTEVPGSGAVEVSGHSHPSGDIPVTVMTEHGPVLAQPDKPEWETSYVPKDQDLTLETNAIAVDMVTGEHKEFAQGTKMALAGTFSSNGVSYYRGRTSAAQGKWFGIPVEAFSVLSTTDEGNWLLNDVQAVQKAIRLNPFSWLVRFLGSIPVVRNLFNR